MSFLKHQLISIYSEFDFMVCPAPRPESQEIGLVLIQKNRGWLTIASVTLDGHGAKPMVPYLGGYSHPFTSYFDVHQGYRVLTHNQIGLNF